MNTDKADKSKVKGFAADVRGCATPLIYADKTKVKDFATDGHI